MTEPRKDIGRTSASRRRLPIIALVALALAAPGGTRPSSAEASAWGASVRSVGAGVRNYDFAPYFDDDYDGLWQTVFRATGHRDVSDDVAVEVHLVESLTWSSLTTDESDGFGLVSPRSRYRALDDTWDHTGGGRGDVWSGRLWLDRLLLEAHFPRMDLTVGRQAVTFGKAYFWNPLDVFLPFDPAQFDRDYKPGVDAVRADIPFGLFSGLTLVYSPGREIDPEGGYADESALDASWYGSACLAHLFYDFAGWDMALQAGKVYGGTQVGAALTGEIAPLAVRVEAARFDAQNSPAIPLASLPGGERLPVPLFEDRVEAVLGVGHRFPSSLDLEAEVLYNGGGSREAEYGVAAVRVEQQALQHLGRGVAGLSASYEFMPLVTGQCSVLLSLEDGSSQTQPVVTVSLSDNSELIAGVVVNTGRRPVLKSDGTVRIRSEFGRLPNLAFAEYKLYF